LAENLVGSFRATVDGLRELARLAGERITSEVDPDFPDTLAALTLGAAHYASITRCRDGARDNVGLKARALLEKRALCRNFVE